MVLEVRSITRTVEQARLQSPLFYLIDIVLGVENSKRGDHVNDFIADMRNYMVGLHRNFLADIKAVANMKTFVQKHEADSQLITAYGEYIEMLKAFRNKHIGVVTRYDVLPSKSSKSKEFGSDVESEKEREDLEITGLAGSALIPFLEQMRDETQA
jgi:indoleamine 2,3-dioxygenase